MHRSIAASVWPGAHQHAAVLGDQRKDVAGAREVGRAGIVVGKPAHGRDAILGRNAGGGAVLVVDRHGERRAVRCVVLGDHRGETQPMRGRGRQRRAHDAAGVADDERHLLRRRVHRRHHEVALVLAVVVVGDHHDLAAAEGFDGGGDARLGVGHEIVDPLLGRHEADEVVRGDGAGGFPRDPLGEFERGEVALADLGDAAGRDADRAREGAAGRAGALKPAGKFHAGLFSVAKTPPQGAGQTCEFMRDAPLILQPVAGLEDPPHGGEAQRPGTPASWPRLMPTLDVGDAVEAPAEAADQIDDRIEQRDRLPERRQHVDRIEAAAEEGQRRDDQQRDRPAASRSRRPRCR